MLRRAIRGMALDKLLIGVILISVVSTAIWNYQVRHAETWADPLLSSRAEERIKSALDDIKYHLILTGYEGGDLKVDRGADTDIIRIRHNGIAVVYRVDGDRNLVRNIESVDRVMAEGVDSIKLYRIGQNSVVVTLSRAPYSHEKENEIETLSKSYSVVVEINNLY